jgi:uncharacterized cupredoxin-like copper-binding protein
MRVSSGGVLAVAILAMACGGGSASTTTGRTIDVAMSEFTYSPATISLKAGETVALRFKNSGVVEHEFMAGRKAMTGMGYSEDWLAMAKTDHGGGHDSHDGTGVRVQPKESASLTLTVPAEKGEFEFGCFMAGHYEGGMKGKLVVQ